MKYIVIFYFFNVHIIDKWSPAHQIRTVLLSIQVLLSGFYYKYIKAYIDIYIYNI